MLEVNKAEVQRDPYYAIFKWCDEQRLDRSKNSTCTEILWINPTKISMELSMVDRPNLQFHSFEQMLLPPTQSPIGAHFPIDPRCPDIHSSRQ